MKDPIRMPRHTSLVCLAMVVVWSVGFGKHVVELPDRGETATYPRTAKAAAE